MEFLRPFYQKLLGLDKKVLVILVLVLVGFVIATFIIPELWLFLAGILGISSTQTNKEKITKILDQHQKQDKVIEDIKEEGSKEEIKAKSKAEKETVDWLDGDF